MKKKRIYKGIIIIWFLSTYPITVLVIEVFDVMIGSGVSYRQIINYSMKNIIFVLLQFCIRKNPLGIIWYLGYKFVLRIEFLNRESVKLKPIFGISI